MIKKILHLLPILFLLGCNGDLSDFTDQVETVLEEQTGQEVDANVRAGVSLGLFSVSINQDGEIEVDVTLETPAIPTPLGGFSVFVEGSAEFPNKKTLTLATPGQTWIYDLNDQPFAVDLNDVDAIVSGDGQGNLTIKINDDRVDPRAEPRFKTAGSDTIVLSTPNITVQSREIGQSFNGNPIKVTQIGEGEKAVVLVGGMHAGFSPGTVSVAEKALEYFSTNGDEVPANVSIYIIPNANPDSVGGGVEAKNGRLNGNGVDINRNFDCNWSSTAEWRSTAINPGAFAFSEPEAQALQDFFLNLQPEAVIFWEARGELVVPGRCGNQFHSDSQRLASVYGARSGYEFGYITGYSITGDVADWLDRQGIAAIAILLSGYTNDDWNRNLRGLQDILQDVSR